MLGIRPGIKRRFKFQVQGLSSYCGHKLGALVSGSGFGYLESAGNRY